jgi:hypothetical protein
MSEFIYIRENPSFNGVVKIGRTTRDVAERVKELLDGLAGPETGESVEIYFDNDDGNLAINIRGTGWVRLEAQRPLSTLS